MENKLTKERAQEYVEHYNDSIHEMPMSYVLYRELLGIFYFLAFNKRFREIIKRLVEVTDKEGDIVTFTDLMSYFDTHLLENLFDEEEIDEFFKLHVVDDE